jgi:cytochrome P450
MNLLGRIVRKVRRLVQPPAPHACTAASIDLGSPAIARDPFPHYEELRHAGRVQYLAHHDAWLVLGHEDVQFAFGHPELLSNQPYRPVDAVLLGADPPDHSAVRRIVSRYFSAAALDSLCAFAEEQAALLVRPGMDVVHDYAIPLSERVAAHFIGFDEDAVAVIRATRAVTPQLAPLARALDAVAPRAAMYERLRADGFDDAEAGSLVRLLWLASTETTERLIARCALRLLQHDDVRQAVTQDPARVPAFVEEVLRLHPPEHILFRVAATDVPLGGEVIPAGATVFLSIAAANRDPAKFDDPSALRLDRTERPLTFGFGIHHCVGATLGRRTIALATRTLLERAPRFRAVRPLTEIPYHSSLNTDHLERLVLET